MDDAEHRIGDGEGVGLDSWDWVGANVSIAVGVAMGEEVSLYYEEEQGNVHPIIRTTAERRWGTETITTIAFILLVIALLTRVSAKVL